MKDAVPSPPFAASPDVPAAAGSSGQRVVSLSLDVESLVADPRINCNYPKGGGPGYRPSSFQSAVLSHCEWQRKLIGHRIGLVVMATAMGKTILALLDIERELDDIHSTLGTEYGIQCDVPLSLLSGSPRWGRLQCPCSVHDVVSNELRVAVPRCLDRMTLASSRSLRSLRSRSSDPQRPQLPVTELAPFRLLFVVHSVAIRNGAYFKFKQHFQAVYGAPDRHFCLFDGASSSTTAEWLEAAKFIFILFQSFAKLRRENAAVLGAVSHVIIDEVHHLLADSWFDVHRAMRSPAVCPSLQYVLGMTATLSHRTDVAGDRLKALFSNIVYLDCPWTTAKALGFFPAVEYLEALPTLSRGRDARTYTQFLDEFRRDLEGSGPLNRYGNRSGNGNGNRNRRRSPSQYQRSRALKRFLLNLDGSLKRLRIENDGDIKRTLTPQYIVRKLLQYQTMRLITNQEVKRRILIFANNAKDASRIAALCNVNGLRAAAVHYKVAAPKCAQILDGFASGTLSVLVNVNVLNEGYDCPAVDCVVMARLTSSEIVFVQQLGRGLRRDPADPQKEICVLDLALNLRRRWKLLRECTHDALLCDYILNFWSISNFVGNPVTMSPAK